MASPILFGVLAKLALSTAVKEALGLAVKKIETQPGGKPLDKQATQTLIEVAQELAKDPAFQNATNNERAVQSRVTVGGIQGFVGGLAFLLPIVLGKLGVQVTEGYLLQLFGAIMAVWGPIYTLWGRWAPGLKPLFVSPWGKAMGIIGLGSILALIVLAIVLVLR